MGSTGYLGQIPRLVDIRVGRVEVVISLNEQDMLYIPLMDSKGCLTPLSILSILGYSSIRYH